MRRVIFLVLLFVVFGCADAKVKFYELEVVVEYPHDTGSYTQGLFFRDGQMYESTGQHGKSTFRKVDLETGKALENWNLTENILWKARLCLTASFSF